MKKTTLLNILLITCLLSCKKDPEPTYSGGKVVLINSDTPVPQALVRFLRENPSTGLFGSTSYTVMGTDTTDGNGHFDIPRDMDADLVRAYGLDSIFNRESQDVYLESYFRGGGVVKLELMPPAWVKVSAVDVAPLNPEIVLLKVDTIPGSTPGGEASLNVPRIYGVGGNIPLNIPYWYIYQDPPHGPLLYHHVPFPTGFDTTIVTLEY